MTVPPSLVVVVAVVVAAGCFESNLEPCPTPAGTLLCPPSAHCLDGACVPDIGCGNAVLDGGEQCDCDGDDCVVHGQVCTSFGADFGELTCGALADGERACRYADERCEVFGWRAALAIEATRVVALSGGALVVLDRLGQIASDTGAVPAAPDVVVDIATAADTVYAALLDDSIWRWSPGAVAWEHVVDRIEPAVHIEVRDRGGVVDLLAYTSGEVVAYADIPATPLAAPIDAASVLSSRYAAAALSANRAAAYAIAGSQIARYVEAAEPSWILTTVALPAGESIVDAARIDGDDWVTTSLGNVYKLVAGATIGGDVPMFGDGELRFVRDAGLAVASDDAVAIATTWSAAAGPNWHRFDPAVVAPLHDAIADLSGEIVVLDARGVYRRAARGWETAGRGLAIDDASVSHGNPKIYFASKGVGYEYDGTRVVQHPVVQTLPPTGNLRIALSPGVRSVCGLGGASFATGYDDRVAACSGSQCGQPVVVPGGDDVGSMRCANDGAWVVTGDRRTLFRFDAATSAFDPVPALAGVDAINDVAVLDADAGAAIVVGRSSDVATAWQVEYGVAGVAVAIPGAVDELRTVHACDGGDWIAGGRSGGRAAVVRSRGGVVDVITLEAALPIISLTGACDAFYAATTTGITSWSDRARASAYPIVEIPMRWSFSEAIMAIDLHAANDPARDDDDELVVVSRSAVRRLR